jgi:hypothetical protein
MKKFPEEALPGDKLLLDAWINAICLTSPRIPLVCDVVDINKDGSYQSGICITVKDSAGWLRYLDSEWFVGYAQ